MRLYCRAIPLLIAMAVISYYRRSITTLLFKVWWFDGLERSLPRSQLDAIYNVQKSNPGYRLCIVILD